MRTNSLSEGVREGLDPELEGSEIPGLVETLHLLGHERLVNLLSLSVGKGDWVKQQSEDKSGHETKRRKNTERNRGLTIRADGSQEGLEDLIQLSPQVVA